MLWPPAERDTEFSGCKIADMGCFTQDGKDSNKYYHAAMCTDPKGNWFVYVEYGRQGAGKPQFQFIRCSSEADAQKEFGKKCDEKNTKRGHHLQYCIRYANEYQTNVAVVSRKYCRTCKRYSWPATKTIYDLLDCEKSHVQLSEHKESNVRYDKVRPYMLQAFGRFDYIRAKGVNHHERSGSVIFFSASGPHAFSHRWRKALTPSEYEPLIDELDSPIFNIGDLPVNHPRVCNVSDLDLLDKFIVQVSLIAFVQEVVVDEPLATKRRA